MPSQMTNILLTARTHHCLFRIESVRMGLDNQGKLITQQHRQLLTKGYGVLSASIGRRIRTEVEIDSRLCLSVPPEQECDRTKRSLAVLRKRLIRRVRSELATEILFPMALLAGRGQHLEYLQ